LAVALWGALVACDNAVQTPTGDSGNDSRAGASHGGFFASVPIAGRSLTNVL